MEQEPQGHVKQLYRMIDAVMKSLKCPLSSVYACKVWPYIVRIAVPDEHIGESRDNIINQRVNK